METVLVTGGAGYIGSHVAAELISKGRETVVFDSLSAGHRQAVPKKAVFAKGNILSQEKLEKAFSKNSVSAVVHLAACINARESAREREKYYKNNVLGTASLLKAMQGFSIPKIVFASSAGVYGSPKRNPVGEEAGKNPQNPYGKTKLLAEELIKGFAAANGVSCALLRFFNVAGACVEKGLGESHCPETHLIPIAVQAALGKRREVKLFGNNFPTRDGTAVRDYVHVQDVASACALALEAMERKGDGKGCCRAYNVGTGKGISNREVVEIVREASGADFRVREGKGKGGEGAALVADTRRIEKELHWKPEFGIQEIIESALQWERKKRY